MADESWKLHVRLLPNGQEAVVHRLLFGYRLSVGPPGKLFFDDNW